MEKEPLLEVVTVVGPAIFGSSIKVGIATGTTAAAIGAVAGLVRGRKPALIAALSGTTYFALGSSYWAARRSLLVYQSRQLGVSTGEVPHRKLTHISGMAGGIAGFVAAALSGKFRVAPYGILLWSAAGFSLQGLYNRLDQRHTEALFEEQKPPAWQKLFRSKYSPIKLLSDEEYAEMLKEKLARVEAEIHVLEENDSGSLTTSTDHSR